MLTVEMKAHICHLNEEVKTLKDAAISNNRVLYKIDKKLNKEGSVGEMKLGMRTRALRALVGVGLWLGPEGKEKGSWWYSTSDLVLIARDAVILLIVALVSAHTNAQNTKVGHYSTAVSIRSDARMTRGWSTPAISNREAASPLSSGK